jgi:uncharacterized membrane protein YciS (DUF1049 family)
MIVWMIDVSIDAQSLSAHMLILRLSVPSIQSALRCLHARIVVRDDEVKRDALDFKQEVLMRIHRVDAQGGTAGENATPTLNASPVSKPSGTGGRGKKDQQRQARTLQRIGEVPRQRRLLAIILTVAIGITAGILIGTLAYLWNTYNTVKPRMRDMGRIGIMGGAVYYTQALIYQYWMPYNDGNNLTDNRLFNHLMAVQESTLTIEDDFIISRISSLMLCPFLTPLFAPLPLLCFNYTGLKSPFSLQVAIHTIILKIRTLSEYSQGLSYQARKEKIEEQDLAWHDMLILFTSATIRGINEDSATRIQTLVDERIRVSSGWMYTGIATILLAIVLFKLYWIRYKLKYWNQTMKLLRILEDQILDNEYIKAYFSFRFFIISD